MSMMSDDFKLNQMPVTVKLSEKCTICDKSAVTGFVDLGVPGAFGSFCPFHLKKFMLKTLKKLKGVKK